MLLAFNRAPTDADLQAWQNRANRIAAKFGCDGELVFSQTPNEPGETVQPGGVIIGDGGRITGTIDSSSPCDFYY
ncbi:MAG TPA: hypothetical protein VGM05_33250 [Planctomycetaceae bacterium]|jgi:hypothetical protein